MTRLLAESSGALNRRIWRLAIPIMITNVSLPLLHAVDTAVVGQLPGAQYVGAVAVGSLIFNVVVFGLSFVRTGTAGLAAQAMGAGDVAEVRASLGRAVAIAVGLGAALIAVQVPFGWAAFAVIGGSPQVQHLAETYFVIRVWGIPASLANLALCGWFIGVQNTKAALWLQLAVNGLNLVLAVVFVLGLGFGVPGVAAATVIAEYVSIGYGFWLAARTLSAFGGEWRMERIFSARQFRRTIAVNRDIFIRNLLIQTVNVTIVSMGARAGDAVLAANAILFHFHTVGAFLIDGFSNAASALVGHAVGARDRVSVRAAARATGIWALGFGVLLTALFFAAAPFVIDAITVVPEVREIARTYMLWAVITPAVGAWAFQMDGVFFGATRTVEMRNAMFLSVLVFFAVVWALFEPLGNHALWLAWNTLSVARALTLGMRYPALLRGVTERRAT